MIRLDVDQLDMAYLQSCFDSEYANWVFETHCLITVSAIQDRDIVLLGKAENQGSGLPLKLSSFSPDFSWTKEHSEILEFGRCDRCKADRGRKTLYIVLLDGKQIQVGGSCAEALDVTNIVARLEACLDQFFGDPSCPEDPFGESFGSRSPVLKKSEIFWIATGYISRFGYTSKKASEGTGNVPTSVCVGTTYNEFQVNEKKVKTKTLIGSHGLDGQIFLPIFTQYWRDQYDQATDSNFEFINNCLLAVLQPTQFNLGFYSWSVKQWLDAKNTQEVLNILPVLACPLDLPKQKTTDIKGVFYVDSFKKISSDGFGYNALPVVRVLVKAIDDQGNGIQLYLSEDRHTEIEDQLVLGCKITVRAGVKGLSFDGKRCALERAKIKIVE